MGQNIFHGVGRVHALRAGGMIDEAEIFFGPPCVHRTDGAGHKVAATGGAHIVERVFSTVCAIGAFIGANARICALRRQVFVAKLAVGPEFKPCHISGAERFRPSDIHPQRALPGGLHGWPKRPATDHGACHHRRTLCRAKSCSPSHWHQDCRAGRA